MSLRAANAKFVAKTAHDVAAVEPVESRQQVKLAARADCPNVPPIGQSDGDFDEPRHPLNPYPGQERRREHRVYVTRNTEYHFRAQTCVAVRDRKTGRFSALAPGHSTNACRAECATKQRLRGSVVRAAASG